jgi:hypothetical protein
MHRSRGRARPRSTWPARWRAPGLIHRVGPLLRRSPMRMAEEEVVGGPSGQATKDPGRVAMRDGNPTSRRSTRRRDRGRRPPRRPSPGAVPSRRSRYSRRRNSRAACHIRGRSRARQVAAWTSASAPRRSGARRPPPSASCGRVCPR